MSYECPFCPCVFVSKEDLTLHVKAFGDHPHLEDWRQTHRDLEFEIYRLHGKVDRVVRDLARIIKKSASFAT